MAASAVVPFTTGTATSSDQTVASGATHILIPITHGKPGKVAVAIKTSVGTN